MTSDRLTRAAAEQMLDGLAHGEPPTRHPVGELLAAAVTRPADRETAGELRALAAYRATRAAATGSTAPARPRVVRLAGLRLAAAAVVLASGAVTVAVATHTPLVGTASSVARTPTGPAGLAGATAVRPGAAPTDGMPAAPPPRVPVAPRPSPSLSPGAPVSTLSGLCRAYTRLPPGQRKKALASPGFTGLVRAAGDVTKVDAYCAALVGPPASHAKAAPAHPAQPHGG